MEGPDGRTEKATSKKRSEERKKGNLCLSQEVISVVVLISATLLLYFNFRYYLNAIRRLLLLVTGLPARESWSIAWLQEMYWSGCLGITLVMMPLIGSVLLAGVVGSMAQTKPYFSWKALKFNLKALNPVKGAKKLFSFQSVTKLLMSLLKIGLIGTVVWIVWRQRMQALASLPLYHAETSVIWLGRNIFLTVMMVSLLAIVIAVIDYIITWRRHEKQMMMTKQEVKDERKQYEGNPLVKRKQLTQMREFTLMQMMAAVPKATVVITNPTHVAVALKYDPEKMEAPKVIAKGLRLRALRIKEIARENGVPVIERPPVARNLYKYVKVGQYIPGSLFEAVAEILAYLYRLGHSLPGMQNMGAGEAVNVGRG